MHSTDTLEHATQPKKPARRRARGKDLTLRDLPRLLEGHELCERIGWELARELAGRIAP